MMKSMTGYGAGSAGNDQVKFTVEIKSLNSKFLELSLRLPKNVADKEFALRSACTKAIERGKVNLSVNAEYASQTAQAAQINTELLQHYYAQLQQAAHSLGGSSTSLFQLALQMPEVIKNDEEAADPVESQLLMDAFQKALQQFDQFRKDEGAVLAQEVSQRIQGILQLLLKVEEVEGDRVPLIRERLSQALEKSVGKDQIDMNRFEQELIYFIDKFDITEEKVRLRSHCNYFIEALKAPDSNGKKLGFISQEIGREVNTLGSKANHAGIQQTVVLMKEELEKIKEQLLNVL
jgi:uncharacterized protein (TIGR00255 family)